MTGWQWFWALVGLVIYLIVLILLYYSAPFEALFHLVVNGLGYANVIFWAAVIVGIAGFCGYHWRAYRVHVARQRQVESMVLSSLRGSTFTAILLSGGATLQAVQILCAYLLDVAALDGEFGRRLGAVVALALMTAVFCVMFWLLRIVRPAGSAAR